jgi:DNA adenine methylase
MSGNSKKLIAYNYFGGKFTWLDHLYANFPDGFINLCDVFGGSLSVSLNYKGKCIRTANEINSDITNFFAVLRDHEAELTRLLLLTPCSNAEYDNCWEPAPGWDCALAVPPSGVRGPCVEQARRFYVRVRQSFFGLGAQRKNKGWHLAKTKAYAHTGETVSKWNNAIEKLHEVANAIRSYYQITNWDFREFITKLDFEGAFFYCDPPYTKASRASYNDYKFEFTDQDHADLATHLHCIQGKAMVSGYDCELMNHLYADWRKVKFPVKKNNIRSGEVQEVIWMNYPAKADTLFNQSATLNHVEV